MSIPTETNPYLARVEAKKEARRELYRRISAEARRISWEMPEQGLSLSVWKDEVIRRTNRAAANEYIWFILDRLEGEILYEIGKNVIRLPGLKEPDPAYLSDYTQFRVPKDAVIDREQTSKYLDWSILNTERALATQSYIQSQLDAGNEILVRKSDGTVEVVQFSS